MTNVIRRLRVACAGAGGHARVVADAVLLLERHEFVGFLDDDSKLSGGAILGFPVLGPIAAWADHDIEGIIPAIGANAARRDVIDRERARGVAASTVVHPRATVSAWARLEDGVVVLAGAAVNAGAEIGENAIINTGAIVEHDCRIGRNAHVAPGCAIAGGASIGEGTLLGIGSCVLPGVRIGDWCVIGAGAVVTKDVPDRATVAGVPARRLR